MTSAKMRNPTPPSQRNIYSQTKFQNAKEFNFNVYRQIDT